MKYIKIVTFAFFLMTVLLSSCEKDDICAQATPTTSKLILRFYDFSTKDETKSASLLRVTGIDDANEEITISNLSVGTTDSIVIPLRTDADESKFTFHLDYEIDDNDTPEDPDDDIILGNPDIVTISYEREEVYVSRACGFKTIFNALIFNVEDDGDNWILTSEIINATVENEISAHVKILH